MLYLVIAIAIILVCFLVMKQAGNSNITAQTPTITPHLSVTVTTEKIQRVPANDVDFDKLEGFERKMYEVTGVGETSGRKRKMTVEAIDHEEAREIATRNNIVVKEITELPERLATESQKEYAKQLGIKFSDDISFNKMSYLLSATLKEPATDFQMQVANRLGIKFNKYAFKSVEYLNDVIRDRLGRESAAYYKEVVKCYVYSVCRFVNREKWTDPNQCKTSPDKIDRIAEKVVSDERIMTSILRQTGNNRINIIYFEQGHSRDTIAYSSIRELIINS